MTHGFVGGAIDVGELTNLGAHEYAPLTGRFISVEPPDRLQQAAASRRLHLSEYSPVNIEGPTGTSPNPTTNCVLQTSYCACDITYGPEYDHNGRIVRDIDIYYGICSKDDFGIECWEGDWFSGDGQWIVDVGDGNWTDVFGTRLENPVAVEDFYGYFWTQGIGPCAPIPEHCLGPGKGGGGADGGAARTGRPDRRRGPRWTTARRRCPHAWASARDN